MDLPVLLKCSNNVSGKCSAQASTEILKMEAYVLSTSFGGLLISLIFDKCSILQQMIWPSNHTSHTKVYFNEFFANVLRDDIGIVIFDLRGHGGC